MKIRPDSRITRRSAARALDQAGSSGSAGVDQILAAATAPATAAEFSREAHAQMMFHRAAVAARADTRSVAAYSRRPGLGAAIAGAAALVLTSGGVTLAATSGHFPHLDGGHRSATGALHSSQAPGHQATHSANPNHPTRSAAPSPSLTGLCNAFQAGAGSNKGKVLASAAFAALATAAGGKANIATYCTTLIGAPGAHPTQTAHPSHPAHPTHPAHPATPTHPAKPTHPPHPSYAATPTHPAKPTHSLKAHS